MVYCLDMFLKTYEIDRFLCTWCIFGSLILLYFSHLFLIVTWCLIRVGLRHVLFPPDAYSKGRSLLGFVAFWLFR